MTTGNFKTFELIIANGTTEELTLDTVVSTEKILKIHPNADKMRLLLTPITSVVVATESDLLLTKDEINDFEIGRGLDRISIYNGSGGEVKVSIAVMF